MTTFHLPMRQSIAAEVPGADGDVASSAGSELGAGVRRSTALSIAWETVLEFQARVVDECANLHRQCRQRSFGRFS